jgi:hypothetical protein
MLKRGQDTEPSALAAIPSTDDPISTYLELLRGCSQLNAPFGAVTVVVLTALVRPHELLDQRVRTSAGRLSVAGASKRDCRARQVPLAMIGAQILQGQDGPLSSALGISHRTMGTFHSELSSQLNKVAGHHPEAAVRFHFNINELWTSSVHALMAAADGQRQCAAVMAYAGIAPSSPIDRRFFADLGESDYEAIAGLIDELVVSAGYAISAPVALAA